MYEVSHLCYSLSNSSFRCTQIEDDTVIFLYKCRESFTSIKKVQHSQVHDEKMKNKTKPYVSLSMELNRRHRHRYLPGLNSMKNTANTFYKAVFMTLEDVCFPDYQSIGESVGYSDLFLYKSCLAKYASSQYPRIFSSVLL